MSRSAQEPESPAGGRVLGGWWSRRSRGRAAVVVLAMMVAGCGQGRTGEDEGDLTPGKFVEVVTALREAERAVAREDSAASLFTERKAEILARAGVTEAEIRGFAAAQDPSALAELWDTIARRLRHVPDEDGEAFRRVPPDDPLAEPAPDTPRGEPRDEGPDEIQLELRDGPRPVAPRGGPPSLPVPPAPPDTGERRLH